MSKEIHIPINKQRLTIQIIVLSVFGIVALIGCFGLADQLGLNPMILQITGIVILIFCVITAGQKVKKRNDAVGGLIFNKDGINDLSSDIALGLIKWKDIVGIDEEESRLSKLLIIKVKKQNSYVKQAKNSAIERLLKQNIRKFDTPVVIDTKFLDQPFEELLELVSSEIKKRRK